VTESTLLSYREYSLFVIQEAGVSIEISKETRTIKTEVYHCFPGNDFLLSEMLYILMHNPTSGEVLYLPH
jgi:hypothetical protein